jgi:hypothetical protein
MTQMLSPPSRSEVNATHFPSGDQRGCTSHDTPPDRSRARPPSAGIE